MRKPLLCLLLLCVTFAPLLAQDPDRGIGPFFPTAGFFRQMFTPRTRYKLELPSSPRDLVQDGHLRLSLDDVTKMVVARNTDLWVARLDVQSADDPVLRAFSAFDPFLYGSFNSSFSSSPAYSSLDASKSLSQATSLTYQQTLPTGLTYQAGFSGTKYSSNSAYDTLNPALTAALNISVTQPLFRYRGYFIQRAPILIARINRQVARDNFATILMNTLQTVQSAYWDVVQARESLVVLRNSVELAQKSYERDKRSLELGALPPLDIFRSESEVANRKVLVSSAEYQLKQTEDTLRRLIAVDLDPDLSRLPLELTDSPAGVSTIAIPSADEAVATGLRRRPELVLLRRQQAISDVRERVALNELKPNMTLGANYSSNGLGGDGFLNGVLIPGGFNDALRQALALNNPTYGFTVTLSLPIKNRAAAADAADASIAVRRSVYSQRSLEQQITLDVRTAMNSLLQSKANIQGATLALDLAQKTLEAEQRKYELGAETIFFVLDAQQRVSDAQTQLLQQQISYRKAVIAVERATGSLLEDNRVILEQALGG